MESTESPPNPSPTPPVRLGTLPAPSVPPPPRSQRPAEPPVRDRDPPLTLIPSPLPPPPVSGDSAIADQLAGLELWAMSNRKGANRTAVQFWLLKAVAGGGAIGASVAASFGWEHGVVALTALVVIAIAVDSASSAPPNLAHQRTFADIRHLENAIKLKWDKICMTCPDAQDPVRQSAAIAILDDIQARRDQIRRYMGSPEAGPASRHAKPSARTEPSDRVKPLNE
jgi:hypothetical protein